jgi:hypothetical protein
METTIGQRHSNTCHAMHPTTAAWSLTIHIHVKSQDSGAKNLPVSLKCGIDTDVVG